MAYITPEERKARAKAVVENRLSTETKKEYSLPVKMWATYSDYNARLIQGAIDKLEGIADFQMGIQGAMVGLVSKDWQNKIKDAIAVNLTDETVGKVRNKLYGDKSIIEDGTIPAQVIEGIGGMLPSVAVTIGTGGLGAPATVAQGASLATTGIGAAGKATESAFNDGASYAGGLGYGATTGLIEAGTEKLFGGASKALYGKGLLDGIGSSVAKKGIAGYVGKVAGNFAGEAIEEGFSEVLDPLAQGIYKGKVEGFMSPEHKANIKQSALVGGITGAVFGETVGRALSPSTMADTTIQSATEKIDNLNAQENRRFINNTLEQRQSKIDRDRLANYKVVEEVLKKSPNRETLIRRYNLPYDAQGNLNADLATKLQGVQTPTQSENAPKSELAYSEKYYSPSLRGTNINERLAEQGTRVYSGKLTTEENARYTNLKKLHDRLSKKGLVRSNLVITDPSQKFDGFLDENTIVLGKETLESDLYLDKLVHEVEHFTEGTKEWVEYADFVFNNFNTTQSIQSVLSKGYGVTQADVDTLQESLSKGELTQGQKTLINEVVAMQSENMFGSEEAINRLTRSNKTLAQKIYNKIKDFIQVLKSTPEEKYIIKKLQTAEKLFEKALSQAGATVSEEAQYSLNIPSGEVEAKAKEIFGTTRNWSITGFLTIDGTQLDFSGKREGSDGRSRDEDHRAIREVYDEIGEDINNGEALIDFMARGNIRISPEIAGINFSVMPTIAQFNALRNYISKNNGEITMDIDDEYGDTVESIEYPERTSATKIFNDIKGYFNEGRKPYISDVQRFRYSLKDSEGNTLSKEQAEFFKDSKVRDKDGNLLVVYHGTNAAFTEFKIGDVGFHVGTKEQAKRRANNNDNANIISLHANIKNPLIIESDYGSWDGNGLANRFLTDDFFQDAKTNSKLEEILEIDRAIKGKSAAVQKDDAIRNLLIELGYDGIIYENRYEGKGKSYIVFDSSQLKLIENTSPTDNPDIRYSLKDSEKTDKKTSLDGLSDAQRTKKLANVGRQKVYTKTDAKVLLDGVLAKYEKIDTFKSEEKAEAVTNIFEALNTVGKENYVKVAENMADYIIDNALNVENRTMTRQELTKDIVKFFNDEGKASKVFVTEAKYKEVDSRNTAINRLVGRGGTLDKLRDIKLGTFLNKSQYKTDIFKGSIEQLTKILNRGHLNEGGTRKILAGFSEWYNKDNPILATDPTDDKPYGFSQEMKDNIDAIANGEGELNTYELKALDNIIRHSIHIVQNFDKVWKGDKWIGKKDEAKTKVVIEQNNAMIKVGWLSKIAPKFSNQVTKYFQYWGDPTAIARRASLYDENGFFVTAVDMITDAEVQTNIDVMNIRRDLDAFKKENKHYERDFKKRTVEYLGHKLPVNNAILAYMSLKRDHAQLGMARNGFTYTDQNGNKVRLGGIAPQVKTAEEAKAVSEEAQKNLYKQFSEADKKYIEIAEKIFNEECKPRKEKMDIQRKGYSNIIEGYYVPLRRANIAKSVDVSYVDELNSVTNPSFNKNTVQGAQGELFIGSIDEVLNRHIKSIAIYSNMAPVIDYYDAVYNYDTGDNPNRPISVATENNWQRNDKTKTIGGDEYIKNMIADIKGHTSKHGVLNFIRKGYAKFQLGLNPKVWATQLSSFFAASKILDNTSIMQGMGIKSSDVNKYAPIAELRANDNIAAMSQGVMYAVEEAGNWSMAMIGKADRLVIKKLFGACQVQVEKNTGLKIGTEENKIKAGEMLQEVILETQQNSFMTSRSQAMRDDNVYTLFTMFSADAMKLFGRVVDGAGKVSVLKAKIKTADAQTKTALEAELKQANKQATKAVGAMMSVAVFMAVIAKAFRWLYKKEEDKDNKEKMETFVVDAVGNMFGGLPVIRDVVGRLTQGYEIDSYAFSTLNNLADSVMKMGDLIANAGNLDENDIPRALKDVLYTGGQLLGIPTRNVYNVVSGLTKRFIPTAGYEMDSMFYNKNYRSDLEKAIKNDDEDMIATIAGIMTDENIGIKDTKIRKETKSLVEKGFDVLPRSIGDKITYNNEEITLTISQKKQFKEVYSGAYKDISTLMSSTFYANASDEVQAKAIAFIYSMYFNKAKETILGVQIDSKASLFAKAISIDKLAIAIATANSFTADVDRNGKAIAGTKKSKVQKYINSLRMTAAEKYMIMGYLGYKNANGDTQVKAYIQKQRMTAEQKKTLYAYSGY